MSRCPSGFRKYGDKITDSVIYRVLAITATTVIFHQSIQNVFNECSLLTFWLDLSTYLHKIPNVLQCWTVFSNISLFVSKFVWHGSQHPCSTRWALKRTEHVTAGAPTVLIAGACAHGWSLHATELRACLHAFAHAFKDDVFGVNPLHHHTRGDRTGCFGCFVVSTPTQRQQVQIWSLSRFAPFSIILPNFPRGAGKEMSSPRLRILS